MTKRGIQGTRVRTGRGGGEVPSPPLFVSYGAKKRDPQEGGGTKPKRDHYQTGLGKGKKKKNNPTTSLSTSGNAQKAKKKKTEKREMIKFVTESRDIEKKHSRQKKGGCGVKEGSQELANRGGP